VTALLWISLQAPARAAQKEPAPSPASSPAGAPTAQDKEKLVRAFLDTPTAELQPDLIPEFLAIDPGELPKKLRQPYEAKRLELYTLKQIIEGKKKGNVRMPEADCAIDKEAKGDSVGVMKMAGYEEISEDEERWVMDKTKCTERDLQCEFTLQVLAAKAKKTGHARRFLFLHPKDPIFALVSQYREQGRAKQTNFFGIGAPACTPH
jgi:hypothetical protein